MLRLLGEVWMWADFAGSTGQTGRNLALIYPTLGLGPGHVPQRSDFFSPHGRDLAGFEPRTFRFQAFPEGRSGCEWISPDPLGYGATRSGWNMMWCWSNWSWTYWYHIWVRFNKTREIAVILLTALQTFNVGMHSNVYEWIWFRLGMMIDTVQLYIMILVLLTLTLIQSHRSARKQKPIHQLSHKVFSWCRWNLVYFQDMLVWRTS